MPQTISNASTRPGSALRPTRLHQALAAALLIGLTPLATTAATIAITSPDDTDPAATTTCTLRQAIVSMNAGMLQSHCANSVPGDAFGSNDTITFASSSVTTMSGATTPGTVTLADSADDTGSVGGTLLITAANLTIDASAWRGSGAGQYPGGVTITRLTSATNDFGIVRDTAAAGSSLTLNGLTLSQGKVTTSICNRVNDVSGGGGVCIPNANLSLTHSTLSGNSVYGCGGGIYSKTGNVTLSDSTVSGNLASCGGGIFSRAGTLTLSDSTVNGNLAQVDGGIFSQYGTLTLINSTVSGNRAVSSGGGIGFGSHSRVSTLALIHATVSNNTAGTRGGGLYGFYGGNVTINNSIVSGNTQTTGSDIYVNGGWTGANNVISVPAANLNLGPLQDNGGTTQTMVPGPGSTAIDGVPAGSCSLATDQRGVARPQGSLCDIGAVEVRPGKDYPSQCSGASNSSETFFDNFPGNSLDPTRWTRPVNSGTVAVTSNSVALSGSPFPYVTAVGSPIPASGEFSVRWVATYGAQQSAGTASLALTQTLPMIGDTGGSNVANAWQDAGGYRVQVQDSASTQSIAYSVLTPTPVRHDVEYCWLSDIADIMEVYVDGTLQLRQARDPSVPRPTTLWFGNPSNTANPSWQPFTLYYVEARALNDVIFKNGFDGR